MSESKRSAVGEFIPGQDPTKFSSEKVVVDKSLPTTLIIPAVTERKENAVKYVVIETLADLVNRPAGLALSFSNLRVLELASKYPDLVEIHMVYLSGFPNAVYSAEFDKLTWSLERTSYDQLSAELLAAKRVSEVVKSQEREGKPGPEVKPKSFDAFDLHTKTGATRDAREENADDAAQE